MRPETKPVVVELRFEVNQALYPRKIYSQSQAKLSYLHVSHTLTLPRKQPTKPSYSVRRSTLVLLRHGMKQHASTKKTPLKASPLNALMNERRLGVRRLFTFFVSFRVILTFFSAWYLAIISLARARNSLSFLHCHTPTANIHIAQHR